MYGLVNRAIEDLIRSAEGEETWERVRQKAGLERAAFASLEAYPDSVTYRLVEAASEVLEQPVERLLEGFGEHWVLYTAQEGYGEMMAVIGDSFEEFLGNLDQMHGNIALALPELRPPSFQCVARPCGGWVLHYRSHRDGLAPMVIGLVRGLGKRFGLAVSVEHSEKKLEGADHDQFVIMKLAA